MPYAIIATTPTYAPAKNKRALVKLDTGRACIFEYRKFAQYWIDNLNSGLFYVENRESGLPQYEIALLHRLPAYLKIQL